MKTRQRKSLAPPPRAATRTRGRAGAGAFLLAGAALFLLQAMTLGGAEASRTAAAQTTPGTRSTGAGKPSPAAAEKKPVRDGQGRIPLDEFLRRWDETVLPGRETGAAPQRFFHRVDGVISRYLAQAVRTKGNQAWHFSQAGRTKKSVRETAAGPGSGVYTWRTILYGRDIQAAGGKLRVKFRVGPQDTEISRVGLAQAGNDTRNVINSTWMALTFDGGKEGKLIPAGRSAWTDWATFNLSARRNYALTFRSSNASYEARVGSGRLNQYYHPGDIAEVMDWNGFDFLESWSGVAHSEAVEVK